MEVSLVGDFDIEEVQSVYRQYRMCAVCDVMAWLHYSASSLTLCY